MPDWLWWLPAMLALYLAGEMLAEALLDVVSRPIGRWLRRFRSPWFLAVLWAGAALVMAVGWWLGNDGGGPWPGVAMFVGGGAGAVAGTFNWYHVVNDFPRHDETSDRG